MTIVAAQAGKHVYCEKQMSMTAMEAQTMCDTCNQADVKLEYHSGGTCFGGASYAIREYVTSGKIGDVYYGRMTSFRFVVVLV